MESLKKGKMKVGFSVFHLNKCYHQIKYKMVKWKCIHTKITSCKKCIDFGHRDCLHVMCDKYDILEIEKIKINFNKNNIGNRYNNCDVDILSYMCELSDFDSVKFLIEEKNYNPNNNHHPLRGYNYLLSSICFGDNFDIFEYIYNHALIHGYKFIDFTYPCIYGNLDILKYIRNKMTFEEKNNDVSYNNGIFHAINRNHIGTVKFLFGNYDVKIDEISMISHAQYANLKIWKILIEKLNITITKEMISVAKKFNNDKKVYVFMSSLISL